MTNEERAVCLFQQIKDTIEWKNRIVHGDGHIVGYIVESTNVGLSNRVAKRDAQLILR